MNGLEAVFIVECSWALYLSSHRPKKFEDLLYGAGKMDEHFRNADFKENIRNFGFDNYLVQ